MIATDPLQYILGLDLGPASIGWAIIALENGEPAAVTAAGVRRFEAGVQGDIEAGRDESRATQRRDARSPRRQTWRRQWRERKIFRILSAAGLLPASALPGNTDDSPDARHKLFLDLDKKLRKQHVPAHDRIAAHVLPYRLRGLALDEKLDLHAVGRALYHLSQRRGYKSNRKALKEDDDRGVVNKGISELAKAISDASARTLGEFFAGLCATAKTQWAQESRIVGHARKGFSSLRRRYAIHARC